MGILDLMNSIEAAGDRGRQRGQQTALGRLYSQAATAPREQRSGLLAQMGAISPQASFDAESHFGQMDDNARRQLGQYAAAFSALPTDQKAAAYPQLAEMGRSLGLPVPQGGYNPAYDAGIAQLGQAFGGMGGQDDLKSLRVGANGNYWAIRGGQFVDTGTPAMPNNQIIGIPNANGGNDYYGVNRGTLGAAPVTAGGSMQGLQYTTSDGEAIAPGDMPAAQAAFAADARGEQFDIPVTGQQLRSAPKPQQAPASFSTLRPDEVAAAGLPAGTFAQRNNATGEIKVGPVQAQGEKPMSAYQRQQFAMKAGKARAAVSGATSDLDRMAIAVKKVLQNRKGLGRITGVVGAFPNIPGSDAANAKADLDALKSQIGFAVLQRMRSMSPTGGALGSVSDAEGKRLEANLAALDTSQSEAQLEQRLNDILDYVETSKQNLRDAYSEQFQPDGPQAPSGGNVQTAPAGADPLGIL